MKKIWYRLFTGAFFVLCAIPALGTLVLGPSEAVANETLVPMPCLHNPDGSLNMDFLSDSGDWFAKHFAFRQELITADSAWKAALFATSSQKLVALGQDGWLYYAETVDDYTGADTITPRQAFCAARSLKIAQEYAEGLDAQFLFTVAPNKLSLYPEHFPGLQRADKTAYDLLRAALDQQEVAYADLSGPLSQAGETLYHVTDSHWNNKGAALAHDVLLENLGAGAGPAFAKPGHMEASHEGDLYVMLYPSSRWLDEQFVFDTPLAFTYDTPVRGPDDILIQTTGQGEGSLLMFRDSFGNALHSLLAESFAHAVFTRSAPYDLTQAASADFVILEIVERNIPRLAQGGYLVPAPYVDIGHPVGAGLASIAEAGVAETTTQPAQGLEGYVQLTGTLPQGCDVDSPVYLAAGDAYYYEAFPTSGETEGFTAVLPLEAAPTHAVCRQGGVWAAYPLI